MHKKTITQKLPINLSTSRWLAYAAAGAASGLVSAPCTEGAIHYSGLLNKRFTGYEHKAFPLAPGASIVFDHDPPVSYFSSVFFAGFAGVVMYGGSIAGFTDTCPYNSFVPFATASNLDSRASIAQQPFTQRLGYLVDVNMSYSDCSVVHGEFIDDRTGYVGFRFDVGNGMQYGWARLHVLHTYAAIYQLLDYAYADPGETIRAGQGKERETSGVTEESLGTLALGAAGVAAWRKRRQRKVA